MTEERQEELVKYRLGMKFLDQQREVSGNLVDGVRQIEEELAKPPPPRRAAPEMVMAGRGGSAKGKKVVVRR